MTTIDGMYTLTRESIETAFETTALAQQQNAQLLGAWLDTIQSGRQAAGDLTLRTVGQAQEAQRLWIELTQESVRNGVQTLLELTQKQLEEAGERLERFSRRAGANGTPAEPATA